MPPRIVDVRIAALVWDYETKRDSMSPLAEEIVEAVMAWIIDNGDDFDTHGHPTDIELEEFTADEFDDALHELRILGRG